MIWHCALKDRHIKSIYVSLHYDLQRRIYKYQATFFPPFGQKCVQNTYKAIFHATEVTQSTIFEFCWKSRINNWCKLIIDKVFCITEPKKLVTQIKVLILPTFRLYYVYESKKQTLSKRTILENLEGDVDYRTISLQVKLKYSDQL